MGNRLFKSILTAIVVLTLSGMTSMAHAQNLVINGDFEANTGLKPNSFGLYDSIPGWKRDTTKLPGLIEIQRENVAGTTPDGTQFLELDSNHPSYVYQDLTTITGMEYNVSFIYSKRANVADNSFHFFWDNEASATAFTLLGNAEANPTWFTFSGVFRATGTTTRIAFANNNPDDSLGAYIDGVSVTAAAPGSIDAVPELGEVAVMSLLCGATGFAILRARARRQR